MAEPIHGKIKRSLQAAEGLYNCQVLLVGKTGVLREIAKEFGSAVVNVNKTDHVVWPGSNKNGRRIARMYTNSIHNWRD